MRTSRRRFLLLVGEAALLGLGARESRARESALDIHRATRNTRLGALGALWPRGKPPPGAKSYPGARRVPLGTIESFSGIPLAAAAGRYQAPARFREAPLSLGQLTRLLFLTNGVTARRGPLALRAAPSAGALYAGEVYVVAESVPGLAPGAYHYDPLAHALVEVRQGSLRQEVARALERPQAIESAAAIVLLTNVFARYTHRYANRGYRYALIDSGHIGENLRLAAVASGLAETAPLRFQDDRLNALLRIDGRREAVCALHAVGWPAPASGAVPRAARRLVEASGDLEGSVIERYHASTKLVPGEAQPAARPPKDSPAPPAGDRIELRRAARAPMGVETAIRQRRSARVFKAEPASLEALAFVLASAQGHPRLERAPGVRLWLAVHRVSGLAPGLYHYEPGSQSLIRLQSGDLRTPLTRACLGQRKAGAAAVGFLMVADLARAARRSGERSYRDLLLESGAVAQRIYLAAESAGLAARNLAAFLDDDLNALIGLDGRREGVLHLTMLGPGD